jgi:hypothetical protein
MTEQLFFVDSYVQTKSPFEVLVGGRPVPTQTVAWHVIEVNAQTCSAGTQYWYTCRPHLPEKSGKYGRLVRDWAGNELRKFNQIELEKFEDLADDDEVSIDPTTAAEMMKQLFALVKKGPPKDAE